MERLRGTYENLSRYYLREARSCFDSRAYRMCVVAAATAIHLSVYFRLFVEKTFNQEDRVASFNDVFVKIKEKSKFSNIANDFEWLMNARNAVAHPDEWLIPIFETPDKDGWRRISLKEKIPYAPDIKKILFDTSIVNYLGNLRHIAKRAIEKAENIQKALGFPVEIGNVEDWKKEEERRISKMTGMPIDLENLPEKIDE